ncbi:MAG: DUF5591 domain-containing protein [Euryarchaeota archaeon]|nr:DUF5591 domain-containing protein [Euryarchaeota archaeon]
MIIEPVSQLGLARHLMITIKDKNNNKEKRFETPNVIIYGNLVDNGIPGDIISFATSYKTHEGALIRFPRADYIPYDEKIVKEGNVALVIGAPKESLKDVDIVFTIISKDVGSSYRRTLDTIIKIRRVMRDDAILYVSGYFKPGSLPILYYFGVDLVDDAFLVGDPKRNVIARNMVKVAEKVRKLIDEKRLRDYIEIIARKSQYNASMIKIGEKDYFKELERGYPVLNEKKVLMTVFEEALYRPDVRRYIERLREYYVPPRSERVLLLIPCSYRKPYSKSKTHREILKALSKIKNRYAIHEVIVTSPLGAVPRELEYVYPAQNYDVPVTGSWSYEEIRVIIDSIKSIINKGRYRAIIAHVPEDYEFLSELGDVLFTAPQGKKITSKESLESLVKVLNDVLEGLDYVDKRTYLKESAFGVLSYQLMEASKYLAFDTVAGKDLPRSRLLMERKQIASFDIRRGYYSFTLHGAEYLLKSNMFWVEIDDFIPKGSVFCAGIIDADEHIREGDEVIITHNGELRAVGIARMSGKMLKDASRGLGVKVRHHV